MRKRFEDVNVIEALHKIMRHNTEHYQSDFEYDIKRLQRAAEDGHGSRCFLWLSRGFGTWCFEERDVYIRSTDAFSTWNYYNHSVENEKAFAVEIEGVNEKAIVGHVFELDYQAHIEEVRKNCFNAQTVEAVFKHPESSNGYTRKFDIDEYNSNWNNIVQRYGEIETLRYHVDDEQRLQEVLCKARQIRIMDTIAGNLDEYNATMVKERFHRYGYTQDDMAFTTPKDAFDALEHGIPVYMLSKDNFKEPVISTDEISYHIFHKGIFGMKPEDKQLLDYMLVLPEKRTELFNQSELKKIYALALTAGQSGDMDKDTLKTTETILYKLDKVFCASLEDVENVYVQENGNELEV